jgi:hypothetical protein
MSLIKKIKKNILWPMLALTYPARNAIPAFIYDLAKMDARLFKSDLPSALKSIVINEDEAVFHTEIGKCLSYYYSNGAFSHLIPREMESIKRHSRILFILRHKKYEIRLQLFFLSPNDCHPPHLHNGIVSAAMLLEGCVDLVEGNIKQMHSANVVLSDIRQRRLQQNGELFYTSMQENGLHFFYADTYSVLVNINIRGTSNVAPEAADRTYADIAVMKANSDSSFSAPLIDKKTAYAKYNRETAENYRIPIPC